LQQNSSRNSRQFSNEDHTLEMSDEELIKEFRMTHAEIENICELVHDKMQPTECGFADLSLKQKILLSLKHLVVEVFKQLAKIFLR